ncbi:MAG: hypothetical protein JW738_01510, partial [Actinobacteria bacterium]|nr:hypothetical protein [Actinomycetota bacterium]
YIDKIDWDAISAVFEGTIVCKGNIYIDCSDTNWVIATDDTLNLVAGGDIEVIDSSLRFIKQEDAHYHFWAVDDIIFNNSNITAVGISTFYGSFTAGDRVIYTSNSLWENTTFKWSRWALDPVAWLPPFKIYTWKEI